MFEEVEGHVHRLAKSDSSFHLLYLLIHNE